MGENVGTKLLEAALEEIGREIGRGIVTTVKHQLNIRCCFSENVETMREEAINLENKRKDLEREITNAWRKEDITSEVDGWLRCTDEIQKKKDEIEAKIPPAQTGFWTKIKSPFSLGNKVKMTTKAMVMYREKVKEFDTLFHSPRPQAALPIPLQRTFALQSRKQMEDGILEAFGEVKVVGIGGMGGLGKTTLAEQIMNRMLVTDKSVDGAVKVVVSQPLNKLKIQEEIAKSLGFEFEKGATFEARASVLLSKLQGATRLLIVLDDIWGEFTLVELGIPLEGGCMTLLTSRNKDLLGEMHAKVFEMKDLSKEEARLLFKDNAGTCVDDPHLESIAKKVVDECKGLTIAIITVGSALKGQPKEIWEGCLRDLRRSNPNNIKHAIEKVYNPLRKSYDLLDGPNRDNARKLFLLCSLFPEDHNIGFEDLVLYSMGLKMFEGADSLEDARYQVRLVIEKLKSRCLLLDGNNENEVKMHDVVRDVAVFIASEGNLFDANLKSKGNSAENYSQWFSAFILHLKEDRYFDHLKMIKFPCLRLLIIHGLHQSFDLATYEMLFLSDISFLKEMPGLFVLSVENATIGASTEIIEWPKNLLALQFKSCWLESDLSFVGELSDLQVLNCNNSMGIEALPIEIGKLKGLKLLNFSRCSKLTRIAPGIISQLIKLEELKMRESFTGWEPAEVGNEEERQNASLKELESLQKLRRLEIQIEDKSLANEVMELSSSVEKYKIYIGDPWYDNSSTYDRAICLHDLRREINDQSWIHKLVATVEELRLLHEDSWGNWRNLLQAQNTIQKLEIRKCKMLLNALVDTSTVSQVFPMLRFLELYMVSDLKQLCDGPLREGSNSFAYLRKVRIGDCGMLQNLVLMGSEKDVFRQLETLNIDGCGQMKQVFLSNENEDEEGRKSTITFPKLTHLILYELPSLTTFGKGFQSIEFPSLEKLTIERCEQLQSLVSSMESEDKSTPLLCTQKVKFGNLKILTIDECHDIRAIFSFPIIESLNSLEYADISRCKNVEEIFRKQKTEDDEKRGEFTFSELKELRLVELSGLTSLGKGIESIELPRLEVLTIKYSLNNVRVDDISPLEIGNKNEGECGCLNLWRPKLKTRCASPMKTNQKGHGCNIKVKFGTLIRHLEIVDFGNLSNEWFHQTIPIGSFRTLGTLEIHECQNIESLFSSSAAENLTSLDELRISQCNNMKKVITGAKETLESFILFPCLSILEITNMPLLEMFCDWNCALELRSLTSLSMKQCPHMKFLTMGSLSTPTLNLLEIDYLEFTSERIKGIEDLNIFLHELMMASRLVPWNIPHESDPSQLNILKLLDPHIPNKVVQLLYTKCEIGILALTSDAAHKLWRWMTDGLPEPHNLCEITSAPYVPRLTDLFVGAPMCNESNDSVGCIALSEREHLLLSASGGKVSMFSMSRCMVIPKTTLMPPPPVATYLAFQPAIHVPCLAYHHTVPDSFIAIGMEDSTIQIYYRWDEKVVAKLEGHQKRISGLVYSQRCNILVSAGADAQLCVWSSDYWEKKKSCPIQTLPSDPAAPLVGETRIQFNSNQSELLVVHETQIAIYNVELECLRSWYPNPSQSLPSPVSCAVYSCDDQMIYTGFYDGAIGIFNNSVSLTLQYRIAPRAYISCSSIPSNGNAFPTAVAAHPLNAVQFAVGMSDGAIYVIEPADPKENSWGPTSQENRVVPSIASSSAINTQP